MNNYRQIGIILEHEPKKNLGFDEIKAKVANGLYQDFVECEDLYDKLNVAYAIAEICK